MGIKDFNNLLRNSKKSHIKLLDAKNIVFDGNNMICNCLSSAIKDLQSNYKKGQFYIIDVVQQTKYILNIAYKNIINNVKRFADYYNADYVWFVTDPRHTRYEFKDIEHINTIDKDVLMEYYYGTTTNEEEEKEDKAKVKNIIMNIKETTQSNRQKITKQSRDSLTARLNNLREKYKDYEGLDIDKYIEIVRQSSLYDIQNFQFYLLDDVKNALASRSGVSFGFISEDDIDDLNKNVPYTEKFKWYFINSTDEADMVIKNICKRISLFYPEDSLLMISTDTDYSVLLSDIPNAYIWNGLHVNSRESILYNPYSLWTDIFEDIINENPEVDINEYIIRLSPLFGNDYTVDFLISLKSTNKNGTLEENILSIFDTDAPNNFSKLSKAYGFKEYIDNNYKYGGLIPFTDFDKLLKGYCNSEYSKVPSTFYKRYVWSVTLYMNYRLFDNFKANTKLYQALNKISMTIQAKYIKSEHPALYTFAYSTDPIAMVKSAKKIENVLSYYASIDYKKLNAEGLFISQDELNDMFAQLEASEEEQQSEEQQSGASRSSVCETEEQQSEENI